MALIKYFCFALIYLYLHFTLALFGRNLFALRQLTTLFKKTLRSGSEGGGTILRIPADNQRTLVAAKLQDQGDLYFTYKK